MREVWDLKSQQHSWPARLTRRVMTALTKLRYPRAALVCPKPSNLEVFQTWGRSASSSHPMSTTVHRQWLLFCSQRLRYLLCPSGPNVVHRTEEKIDVILLSWCPVGSVPQVLHSHYTIKKSITGTQDISKSLPTRSFTIMYCMWNYILPNGCWAAMSYEYAS